MAIVATSKHNAQPFRLFFAASILGHLLLAGVVFAMNGFTDGSPAPKSGETLQKIMFVFETEKQPQIETKTVRPQTEYTPPLASKHANLVDTTVAMPRVYPTIKHASLSAPASVSHAAISVLPKPKKLQAVTTRAEPLRDRNLKRSLSRRLPPSYRRVNLIIPLVKHPHQPRPHHTHSRSKPQIMMPA